MKSVKWYLVAVAFLLIAGCFAPTIVTAQNWFWVLMAVLGIWALFMIVEKLGKLLDQYEIVADVVEQARFDAQHKRKQTELEMHGDVAIGDDPLEHTLDLPAPTDH